MSCLLWCPDREVTLYGIHLSLSLSMYRVFIIVVLYYGYVVFASFMLQFYVPMDFLEIPFFKLIRLDSKIDRLSYSHPHLHGPAKWIAHTIFRTTIVLITGMLYTTTLYTTCVHIILYVERSYLQLS